MVVGSVGVSAGPGGEWMRCRVFASTTLGSGVTRASMECRRMNECRGGRGRAAGLVGPWAVGGSVGGCDGRVLKRRRGSVTVCADVERGAWIS